MQPEAIISAFRETYGREPAGVSSAPGRIEFVGNHTDYNGGLVLGAAIDRFVIAAASPRPDGMSSFSSAGHESIGPIEAGTVPVGSWATYVAGVAAELSEHVDRPLPGFDLLLSSDLPVGSGLSSSAAIEMATAVLLDSLFGLGLGRVDLARIGRRAENRHVGVPCGILDQAVVTFGRANHLVRVDANREIFDRVPIPGDTRFWILDSGKRHRLSDGHYAERHTECRAAWDVLKQDRPQAESLADVEPEVVAASRAKLSKAAFRRAMHITNEHRRVARVIAHLETGQLHEAGALLVASHASSRDLFENSTPELDFLVERLARSPDVLGARLTGGGFGGAVLAWTGTTFGNEDAAVILDAYRERFDSEPSFMACSAADGARMLT